MKKIIYLFVLVIGVTSCSVESVDSTENFLTADFTLADSEFEVVSHDFYTGNDKNPVYKGTLSVSQDCDNLYIAITGEPEEVYLGVFNDDQDPELKNNGDIAHSSLPENLASAINQEWVFPLSTFTTESVKVFARSWGGKWAGAEVFADGNYLIYNLTACETVCPEGKGYWKNHSSDNPGEQQNMWPVSDLMLGNTNYSQQELNEIMDVPNNQGNNLVILSQHLIAAKLNVANGAGTSQIEPVIAEADALIGDLRVLIDAFTDGQKNTANDLKTILEAFNEADCE